MVSFDYVCPSWQAPPAPSPHNSPFQNKVKIKVVSKLSTLNYNFIFTQSLRIKMFFESNYFGINMFQGPIIFLFNLFLYL